MERHWMRLLCQRFSFDFLSFFEDENMPFPQSFLFVTEVILSLLASSLVLDSQYLSTSLFFSM
jgi:hypothetical protein